MNVRKADVVIIGSGLAGLMTAYHLCPTKNVMLITKSKLHNSNSWLAQGGIAAVVHEEDRWQDHFDDTITAGGFHNRKETTELLVQKGNSIIQKLTEIGVHFDKDENDQLALGMEGAHGRRRILHAGGDATGKAIVAAVIDKVLPNITVIENEMAFDLIVVNGICRGLYSKDVNGNMMITHANQVILATGGVGQLYSVTSNCTEATGDGIAMAYRAGAEITDMEFIQFHPTLLVNGTNSLGLISEAVRGEGAKLITDDGILLMKGKHAQEDLAPRDIVAREIFHARQKNREVFLDIKKINNFKERFPSIFELCSQDPISFEKGLLPVKPGAHFIMGGIKVDDVGETKIKNLYAVGECAYTGVHGANRLASNSLLEGVVFAEQLARAILEKNSTRAKEIKISATAPELTLSLPTKVEIQQIMDQYVGIVRERKGLQKAINWFNQYQQLINSFCHLNLSRDQKTICNMITVGHLIATSSFSRCESRGGHYREDYPVSNDLLWFGYRNVHENKVLYKEKFQINEVVERSREKKELSIS